MLTLENIHLQHGAFSLAIDRLNLTPGITAILGPSGAGKSTFLNLIAGFHRPVSGSILFQETNITYLAPAKRPVAILFQDNNLFSHLSVTRNIALALTHKSHITQEQTAKITDALAVMGLSELGARKPAQLSGGQISRVALARVLLQNKPVLLLDEPFAALGPAHKAEMLERVEQVAQTTGAIVLMVTHDPNDAQKIAPQTLIVANNTLTGPFPTQSTLENPPDNLAQYLNRAQPSSFQ